MTSLPLRRQLLQSVLDNVDNVDMSTFRGRLILQKTVYLLQAFGVSLGYRYSWYLFGPYSSDLAKDGFEIGSGVLTPPITLSDKARLAFESFRAFIDPIKRDEHRLELLASVHFLARIHGGDMDKVRSFIHQKRTHFTDSEISAARATLLQAGLS